jgi:hypothetical protein
MGDYGHGATTVYAETLCPLSQRVPQVRTTRHSRIGMSSWRLGSLVVRDGTRHGASGCCEARLSRASARRATGIGGCGSQCFALAASLGAASC